MKKMICVLMIFALMIGFAACGKNKVQGTWLNEDGDSGYEFGKFGEVLVEGEKMGTVKVLPQKDGLFQSLISYYYRINDDGEIEILRYSPDLSGSSVSVSDEEYDVLEIKKVGKKTVLVSKETDEYYYLEKD